MYIYIMSYIYIYVYLYRQKRVQIWTFRARESDYVAISKADLCSGCSSTCSNNCHTLRCQDVGGTRSDDVHTAASFQHPSSGRLQ